MTGTELRSRAHVSPSSRASPIARRPRVATLPWSLHVMHPAGVAPLSRRVSLSPLTKPKATSAPTAPKLSHGRTLNFSQQHRAPFKLSEATATALTLSPSRRVLFLSRSRHLPPFLNSILSSADLFSLVQRSAVVLFALIPPHASTNIFPPPPSHQHMRPYMTLFHLPALHETTTS